MAGVIPGPESAIVLPASTYPLEIVQAARFLERYENDSTVEPDTDWDESVVALLNYPEIVALMKEVPDLSDHLGACDEDLCGVVVAHEVQVALAILGLTIGNAVPFVRHGTQ